MPTTAAVPLEGSGGRGQFGSIRGILLRLRHHRDIPYGPAQLAESPGMVSELTEQTDLRFIAHVGDIKAGSEQCTDERFVVVKDDLDRLRTPLV